MRPQSAEPAQISRLRAALGTFVAFEAEARTTQQAADAIDSAAAAVMRVDRLLHPTHPGSDLANINAGAVGAEIHIDRWSFELLQLSQRLHRLSKGVFDPCLPVAAGRLRDLELHAPDSVIVHAPVSLDLGGIAKGFAVDCAIEALRDAGCTSALVNAGGDMRVFGERDFQIACRDACNGILGLTLRDTALAVSRIDAADRPPEHRGYYRRVQAASDSPTALAAAVYAPSAVMADALTKCALLCSVDACSSLLQQFGATRLF